MPQWKEGGETEVPSVTSPNSYITLAALQSHTSVRTDLSQVATGTYKALCGIVHEAQLEAMLVLKGLRQGLTQVVRRQGALLTLLELGEKALRKRAKSVAVKPCLGT